MKRDMDLVFKLLERFEQKQDEKTEDSSEVNIPNVPQALVKYHIDMMYEQGFLRGYTVGSHGTDYTCVNSLSWTGHDYLKTLRNANCQTNSPTE